MYEPALVGVRALAFVCPDSSFSDLKEHMNQFVSRSHDNRSGQPLKVAVISAEWHRDVVTQANLGIEQEFNQRNLPPESIQHFTVPGAFEIPFLAKRLAKSGGFDAIIACALVVDGGIYRHDFVASAVVDGLMRVQLDTDVPVFSVVLTPHQYHDSAEHKGFFQAHFVHKGVEAAKSCLSVIAAMRGDQVSGQEALTC